jgi:exopolysaccharide biosynthesis predicted pyruvyltransferase EpsI
MTEHVEHLRERTIAAVKEAVSPAGSCGLVDFPRHLNVGDSAIWLGERAILAQLGVEVRAACDFQTYDSERFRRRLGDAPIFFHGGGNFGGLYAQPQAFRERILRDYADRPIVQLPQTVNFASEQHRERTHALIAAHGNVTLMVRDHDSAKIASEFDARVILSPDAAFALGALPRRASPRHDVLYLERTDFERASEHGPRSEDAVDWLELEDRRARLLGEWHKLELGVTAGRLEGGRSWLPSLANRAYDRYASWNVLRGTRLLASGRSVITDRLHAHILCTLLNIPHVLIDDRYGKVSSFWRTWSSEIPFARLARDSAEARTVARSLLDAA